MRAMGKLRLIGYGSMFLCLGALLQAASAPTIRSAENRWFEIVALDAAAAGYTEVLSRHLVDRAMVFMDARSMDFPQRILVKLRPPEYADFEEAFRIELGDGGFVTLNVRWDERLDLATFCTALSEAFILRYTHYNYGPDAVLRVPGWTVQNLGQDVYFSLRPALLAESIQRARQQEILELSELLSMPLRSDRPAASGFLLMDALQRAGMPRGVVREIYRTALSGGDVIPLITAFLGIDAVDVEAWWSGTYQQLGQTQMSVFERLEDSRDWVEALASFEREEAVINLRRLWELREDPAIRDLVAARLDLLRIRIIRVNPAYFNAARSLGVLFEIILDNGRPHEYIGALSKYLSDRDNAREIERIVRDALLPVPYTTL